MATKQLTEEEMKALMNRPFYQNASIMHILLTGYSRFVLFQMKKGCIDSNMTYSEAEYVTDKVEEIIGIKIAPTQLLPNKNKLANELIEDYLKLQELLKSSLNEKMCPIAMSFYHHLYFKRQISLDRLMPIQIGLSAFLDYVSGIIDKKELKKQFFAFDYNNKKIIKIDSKYIRQDLITFQLDFSEICVKCAIREMEKRGDESPFKFKH